MAGLLTGRSLYRGSTKKAEHFYSYDNKTGNLTWRSLNEDEEYYTYDALDRLTETRDDLDNIMQQQAYATSGNITSKTGIGNYTYSLMTHPHAVTSVENSAELISGRFQQISYNAFGKADTLRDADGTRVMAIVYGTDRQRWKSVHTVGGQQFRTILYGDGYEQVTQNDTTHHFFYLGDGILYVKEDGQADRLCCMETDRQGSILRVWDSTGAVLFAATYDAWGKCHPYKNDIAFQRGYTGHEMLPEFGLINMNGRMYDPLLGRFLSPDNYVQMPDFSQNFNRYSYCLNNPLKYVDPDGELAWFLPVIIGAAVGAYVGASIQSHTAVFWHWKSDAWKGAIVGGIFGGTLGYMASSAIGTTGLTEIINGVTYTTKGAGITSSILNSGTSSIALDALSGVSSGDLWKSGLSGLITGAWSITGGFGMVKGWGAKGKMAKLAGKLGYQMTGTTISSVGNNLARGRSPFSRIVLGVGPINLTIGKGEKIVQFRDNIGNIAMNLYGMSILATGGHAEFDANELTVRYRGGVVDKLFNPNDGWKAGFGPYVVTGNEYLNFVYSHELHHLWHSRALNNLYLLNYGLQGIGALLLKDIFVGNTNYYETIAEKYLWWE